MNTFKTDLHDIDDKEPQSQTINVRLPSTRTMCNRLILLNRPQMHAHRASQECKRYLKALKLVDLYRKNPETVKRRHSQAIVKQIEKYIAKHDGTDSRNDGNASAKKAPSS